MSNMVVQTNILALNSHRNLSITGGLQSKASQKLSSGYKINSAADDAAGLAISEKMRAQIRGLDMASKNAQDGISMVQTAEGGMQEIDNMLQRIRELVDYSANDTQEYNVQGTSDRNKIQDEIDSLIGGIDAIAGQVEFNKKRLIDGSYMSTSSKNEKLAKISASLITLAGSTGLTAGSAATAGNISSSLVEANKITATNAGAYSTLSSVSYMTYAATDTAFSAGTSMSVALGTAVLSDFSISNAANIDKISEQISAINKFLEGYDAAVKASAAASSNGLSQITALADSERKVYTDAIQSLTDLYKGVKNYDNLLVTRKDTQAMEGKGLWLQVGANANQGFNINVGAITSYDLGIGDGKGLSTLNVTKSSGRDITDKLDLLDKSLSYVTTERSKLGAIQNRLEYTIKSLDISSENLSSAESRIRDTDMAKEMMNLTKSNVLQQAGISMLTQANQAPQSLLSLLR